MVSLIMKLLSNKKAIMSAITLVELIQSTTADGKMTRKEQSELLSAFWVVVSDIRGVENAKVKV